MYFPLYDRVEASNREEAIQKVEEIFKQQYDSTIEVLNKIGLTFTHPFKVDEDVFSEEVEEGVWDVKLSMSFAEDLTNTQTNAFNNFMMSLYEEK